MPAERPKLQRAADANVGSAVVDRRRRGAHGWLRIGTVFQLQRPFAPLLQPPAIRSLLRLHAAEPSALGCKIEALRFCIIADRTAHIAEQTRPLVEQPPSLCVQHQQAAGLGAVAVDAVVRADQHIILAGIRACPVESTLLRPIPTGRLFLLLLQRLFIRDGQADKIRREFLTAPEARVEIVSADRDGAVRLTLERIVIDPE